MSRLNVAEEAVCCLILLYSILFLETPLPFATVALTSILNIPELFPPEDSRYFETARQRTSSGFCSCTLAVALLHASVIKPESDSGRGESESIHLGFAYSSILSFGATQILYSALFSGLYIPFAISITLMVLPCVISAQIFGIMEIYDFDSSVEVAFLSLLSLSSLNLLQTSLKQSFSSGESFVVSTSIISSLVAFYNHGKSYSRDFEIIISTFGFSGIIITAIIIFSGYSTRVERNSSPNLTPADAQLSLTYHIGIILVPILATCVAICAGYETSPLILLITRAIRSIDFAHLALLVWGAFLVTAAIRLAKPEFASAKPELTTQQRKLFHILPVLIYLPAMEIDGESFGIITFGLFWVFIWLSLYSAYQIYPYGGSLRRNLVAVADYRDNGKLILTPIYLIFGFSFPIWLDLFRFGRVTLASYSGIISLGIGDTAASIIGKKFGKIKFGRDGKTLEGMVGNFLCQILVLFLIGMVKGETIKRLLSTLPCLGLCAALEATTDQIDNLLLPIFQYSLLTFAQ
jgi:dolichol kinase